MRINDQLYVYLWNDPRKNNCVSVFIDGKTPTLIDPGHASEIDYLFQRMEADGVDPSSTRLIIGTHGHPDHIEGAARFDRSVKVALSRREEAHMEEMRKTLVTTGEPDQIPITADLYLKEGDLVVGKHEFRIISTPGHTPGGISVYWPRRKVLFSGDVVFLGSIGRTDFPGGDVKALTQSIEKLAALQLELIIPGHGSAIQGADLVRRNFTAILQRLRTVR